MNLEHVTPRLCCAQGIKNMISTVEYNLGELMHESRMIYFTNQSLVRAFVCMG